MTIIFYLYFIKIKRMKKLYTFLFSLLLSWQLSAQITINSADLPSANDTFRVSTGQAFSGMDATISGANVTWDYSQLTSTAQSVDSFLTVGSTATVYSIVFFDNVVNPNRANQAVRGPSFNFGGQIDISDVFNFYYKSSSIYKQIGFGAAVNGVTIPVIYSPHEVIYNLPINFGDTDSSTSGYELDLTSTIGLYYKVNRTRHNSVDGWGTLTTPYGTFDALRVMTTIGERDSIYIDSLGIGFNTPVVTTKEYKWLGLSQGVPLLQINTTNNGIVTQITYKDSLPSSSSDIVSLDEAQAIRSLFPNPSVGPSVLHFELKHRSSVSIEIVNSSGQLVYKVAEQKMDSGQHFSVLNKDADKLSPGTYFVRLIVDGKANQHQLIIAE